MRRLISGLVALSVVLGVAACSVPGFGDKPEGAVKDLAQGLSSRQLGKVAFVGETHQAIQQKLDALLAGVSDLHADVQAGPVKTSGSTATAQLVWHWTVSDKTGKTGKTGKTWSYPVTASLKKVSGDWDVEWSPSLVEPSLKTGETLEQTRVPAKRGDIIGARDVPLVTPRAVTRFGIDKTKVPAGAVDHSARALADLLGIDPAKYQKLVDAAGPKAFVPALVLRRVDVTDALHNGYKSIPGARALDDELPLGPTKDFAAALLGTVGPATAEIIKKSKGRIEAGDDVGLSGLEQRYDEQLAGTPGTKIVAVNDKGAARELFSAPPVDGRPLTTTLDDRLEAAAQNALADVVPASAIVAIRPSTGAVLAVASGPGSKGYNTATIGQYAPGSTFKVVTSLALLRAGLTENSIMPCDPQQVVNGKSFKNYSDYPPSRMGRITLKVALANSCNTAFISQRDKITPAGLRSAAATLGFGVDHDTGFPTFFGELPGTAGETDAAADMIGQGKVLASPFAMATVVASVVKGVTVVPHLILTPASGTQTPSPTSPAGSRLTGKEQAQLEDMMRAVVEQGSGAFLQSEPGPPVLAKTGTAEYGDTPPLPTHAWMVAAHGDLAVAVFVADGSSGAGTAGPILKQFLDAAN